MDISRRSLLTASIAAAAVPAAYRPLPAKSQEISERETPMLTLKTRNLITAVGADVYDTEHDTAYSYPTITVDPTKTALVIIDPWAWHPNDGWLARAAQNMTDYLAPLVAACRASGIRVVYAPTGRQIASAVAPLAGDLVIDTPGSNTDDTVLDQALLSWGVDTLLYAGYASNLCVLEKRASARWMKRIRAGRRYVFVRDASVSMEIPETIGTMALHTAAVAHFEFMFGASTTVAEVLEAVYPPPVVTLDLDGSSLTDASTFGHVVSAVGNAAIVDSAIVFDGVSDRLVIADHAAWHMPGDFTIEFDGFDLKSGDPGSIIMGQALSAGAGTPSWLVFRNSSVLGFNATTGNGSWNVCAVFAQYDTSGQDWRSYRIEKRGSTLRIFVDGAQIASGPCGTMPNSAHPLTIGGASQENNDLAGKMRSIKITKGG